MAADHPRPQHLERTAADPRAASSAPASISSIGLATPSTRLLSLDLSQPLPFQAGQWLDVWLPGVRDAGGFTIVSSPSLAAEAKSQPPPTQRRARRSPQVQLAVRRSGNPPAAWLWRDEPEILGADVTVRVGGKFTWPPPGRTGSEVEKVLFVAGGVGINPFVSMIRALDEADGPVPEEVVLMYGCKLEAVSEEENEEGAEGVLFLAALKEIFERRKTNGWRLKLYLTGNTSIENQSLSELDVLRQRMTEDEAISALGHPSQRAKTLAYVCGPQAMTDAFVSSLSRAENMSQDRVLCEKWW